MRREPRDTIEWIALNLLSQSSSIFAKLFHRRDLDRSALKRFPPYALAGIAFLVAVRGWCAEAPVAPSDYPDLVVRPVEIHTVLINPGIGFTDFNRLDGKLFAVVGKKPWLEGYTGDPSDLPEQSRHGKYPATSVVYIRLYWRDLEPEDGHPLWGLIDEALTQARKQEKMLMLRIMPYGDRLEDSSMDVPDWYRRLAKEPVDEKLKEPRWRVDPENPLYAERFGGLVRQAGQRYDGRPELESVDMAMEGPWGEGDGAELLSEGTRQRLRSAYFESFKKTPLLIQLTDKLTWPEIAHDSFPAVGFRVDCLGDLGFFSKTWNHMEDYYPQIIVRAGLADAWMNKPVMFEACGVLTTIRERKFDLLYIIDQSLKWHMSTFNAKSSPVPSAWKKEINEWLKKMGYRFVLRKFSCRGKLVAGQALDFSSWWENKGDAPAYRNSPLALRLKNADAERILLTDTDIRTWLPGDTLRDGTVHLPSDLSPGDYELSIALVDPDRLVPRIHLAIAGEANDGWTPLGDVHVTP